MKKSTQSVIRSILGYVADSVGKNKYGNIVVRRGYFYHGGMDSGIYSELVKRILLANCIDAVLVGCSDNWKPFKAGASVARSSHFAAEFKIYEKSTQK